MTINLVKNTRPNILQQKTEKRHRDITVISPRFSTNGTTSAAKIFVRLFDKHFPKFSKLHEVLNRNTVKVSQRYMENIRQTIKRHNKKASQQKKEKSYNTIQL